jgi:hypothetical protein
MKLLTLSLSAALLLSMSLPAQAICAASQTITGTFKANDGGTYRVRVLGADVWWLGESADDGASWTNIFKGTRNGDVVEGSWADIRGSKGSGTLKLRLIGKDGMERLSSTGSDFGGKRWSKPCNDTVQIPQ